jgi:hypothetical protein
MKWPAPCPPELAASEDTSLARKDVPNMLTLESLPADFNSDRLVSDQVAAELMDISLATLRRMRALGEGPPRRRISQRRYGTRLRDIAAYLERAAV